MKRNLFKSVLIAATVACAAISPALAQEETAQKSADEIARELASPNNSLASLTFKNQFRWYDGELAGSRDQENYTLLFQPVFPFGMPETASGGKANLFIRPAFPLVIDQPLLSPSGRFDQKSGLGDIGFDIGYGVTEKSGLLWAAGMVGTLPTAVDSDLGGKQLRLGPELLLAKFEKWGLYGIFPSHQWNVAGNHDRQFSTTQIQAFLMFLPGGGWAVGSAPIMTYDWRSEQWSVPVNLSVSRTLMFGKMPVKVGVELNYYVERASAFGQEWMVGLNITPVVPNFIEKWIRGRKS